MNVDTKDSIFYRNGSQSVLRLSHGNLTSSQGIRDQFTEDP